MLIKNGFLIRKVLLRTVGAYLRRRLLVYVGRPLHVVPPAQAQVIRGLYLLRAVVSEDRKRIYVRIVTPPDNRALCTYL